MSEGISAPFIRYPIGTSLMMAGILFVGLVAYPLLPVAPLPQVDFPTIQVTANLPGGSPETMASSVAQPLERQLAQIPGVAQMTSTSYLGTAAVTIQFDLNRRARSTPPAASCRKTCPRRRHIARSTRRTRRSCCCRRLQTACR
jgi:HAE1 family hydrophobic/amphiphilic exporter-1